MKKCEEPITTVMLQVTTSITDKPTKAQAYRVTRFRRLRAIPPAIAISIKGQLFCTNHPDKIQNISQATSKHFSKSFLMQQKHISLAIM